MNKSWVLLNLSNLLIVSFLGIILRFFQLFHTKYLYGNYLHTHSHVAILGWIFLSFFIAIYYFFIPKNNGNLKNFQTLYIISQISVWGMLLSFPFQGYGSISIAFSTIHILCAYAFVWLIWKNINLKEYDQKFLKTSLIFMVISTLGIWGLGGVISMVGKNSFLYHLAIQFFLHFQIQGWFLFALWACLFKLIKNKLSIYPNYSKAFFNLNLIAVIYSFSLPILKYQENQIPYLNIFLHLSSILNFIALLIYLKHIHPKIKTIINSEPAYCSMAYHTFLLSYILKIIVPIFLLISNSINEIIIINNFYIGFIHLTVLGVYSFFIFFLLSLKIEKRHLNKFTLGLGLVIIAFIITELLLMIQGFFIYFNLGSLKFYYPLIISSSILFPIGIVLILLNFLPQRINKFK